MLVRGDEESTWSEVQLLLPSDGVNQDRFGICVSVSGDILAVGSSYHDSTGCVCIHEEYLHIANA